MYQGLRVLSILCNAICGPGGRTRTDTSSLTADFESAASTNFTTPGRVAVAYDSVFLSLVNFIIGDKSGNCLVLNHKVFNHQLLSEMIYPSDSAIC